MLRPAPVNRSNLTPSVDSSTIRAEILVFSFLIELLDPLHIFNFPADEVTLTSQMRANLFDLLLTAIVPVDMGQLPWS